MASLQGRRVRGHTSWDLVESRRINGKPRPIPLAYLGKADARLARLQATETLRRRSGAALAAAHPRQAPVTRDGLTVGQTVTLVGIGRACHATSKRGFADWARPPSLGDLAGTNGERLTRQHFWDQMDPAPGESLAPIACEIVRRVLTRLALHVQLTGPDPPLTLPYQFSREAFEAPDRGALCSSPIATTGRRPTAFRPITAQPTARPCMAIGFSGGSRAWASSKCFPPLGVPGRMHMPST